MVMQNKKGLSPIIATVLLILLTVSAATFISVYLFEWFPDEFEKTKCNNYIDYFYFNNEFGFNCYENSGNNNNYTIESIFSSVKVYAILKSRECESVESVNILAC